MGQWRSGGALSSPPCLPLRKGRTAVQGLLAPCLPVLTGSTHACLPACLPLQLRVSGLATLEQAEVARDLLALWGWQAAQRLQQPTQQAQQPTASGAGGGAGSGAGEEGGSPPLPPLNFPYAAYAEHTPWLGSLAGLSGEGPAAA